MDKKTEELIEEKTIIFDAHLKEYLLSLVKLNTGNCECIDVTLGSLKIIIANHVNSLFNHLRYQLFISSNGKTVEEEIEKILKERPIKRSRKAC